MENYPIGALVTISIIGIIYYVGGFTSILKWCDTRKKKVELLLSVLNNIKNDIESNKKSSTVFNVNDTDTSASIVYQRMGEQYIMLVPYTRKYVAAMSQFTVTLLRSDNTHLNITQQPGIPYLVNAENLGGYGIRITNQENNMSYTYFDEILPMYGEEVMDSELDY
jgi:hypothetical protein